MREEAQTTPKHGKPDLRGRRSGPYAPRVASLACRAPPPRPRADRHLFADTA
jgi:hypothetical protein